MKLYLSSYRLGADRNALAELIEPPGLVSSSTPLMGLLIVGAFLLGNGMT
jgi:hypothetical protein